MSEYIFRLVISYENYSKLKSVNLSKVTADDTWKIGDFRGKTRIVEQDSGAIFEAKGEVDSCKDYMLEIRDRVKEIHSDLVRAVLNNEIDIQLSCVVYSKSAPELNFDAEDVRWMSGLGASLDIQVYQL